jgi:hypothetical protein
MARILLGNESDFDDKYNSSRKIDNSNSKDTDEESGMCILCGCYPAYQADTCLNCLVRS